MEVKGIDSNTLSIDTKGWIPFGQFLGEVIDLINKGKITSTAYNLDRFDIFNMKEDDHIELGVFAVASQGVIDFNLARIGIQIKENKRPKREFTILGVDFNEVDEICSVPGLLDCYLEHDIMIVKDNVEQS